MKFNIKLKNIKSVEEIEGYWKKEDYIKLLELFGLPKANEVPEAELFDMLALAISDYEPSEAAVIVLTYKLENDLNENQIENLSHEMLADKIVEEFPEIHLHYAIYNVNQLLYKAYNGKFPNTIASVIDIELTFKDKVTITKEIALRTMSEIFSEKCLIKRLFSEKLEANEEFEEANGIIWDLKSLGENSYQIITSDYWISNEDFQLEEFSGELSEEEIEH